MTPRARANGALGAASLALLVAVNALDPVLIHTCLYPHQCARTRDGEGLRVIGCNDCRCALLVNEHPIFSSLLFVAHPIEVAELVMFRLYPPHLVVMVVGGWRVEGVLWRGRRAYSNAAEEVGTAGATQRRAFGGGVHEWRGEGGSGRRRWRRD